MNKTTHTPGKVLHSIEVRATVHYQRKDGEKNYHEEEAFNEALADEVRLRWDELKDAALERLREKVDAAKEKAKNEYRQIFYELTGETP